MSTEGAAKSILIVEMSRNLHEGPARSAIQLIRDLDPKRYSAVPVFSLEPAEHVALEKIIGAPVRNIRMPRPKLSRHFSQMTEFASLTSSAVSALAAEAAASGASIIHANSIINLHAALASGKARLPFIVTVREMLPARTADALYTRWICGRASAVIAVSRAVRENLIRAGADEAKISIVRNGIDIVETPPEKKESLRREFGVEPGAPTIGIVGSINSLKGHLVLVKALDEILRKYPLLKLLIVGDAQDDSAEYLEQVRGDVRAAGFEDRVVFTGRREDARDIIAAFDVCVQPSTRDDSLPRTVLEAMAAGIPVVASRIGGIPEMVHHENTGLLVTPGDARELASA
ncbi:MAG TPA: glycosyltransferase family 4 protein, partial [bacterium]|nr:glycosyltransferase family 4 protein [bacterium]